MFDAPESNARQQTRGVRFTDEELRTIKKLRGTQTFSAYVRALIHADWQKRGKR